MVVKFFYEAKKGNTVLVTNVIATGPHRSSPLSHPVEIRALKSREVSINLGNASSLRFRNDLCCGEKFRKFLAILVINLTGSFLNLKTIRLEYLTKKRNENGEVIFSPRNISVKMYVFSILMFLASKKKKKKKESFVDLLEK